MATFKFGRTVDIHWNGFEVVGPADTVFSIPDQLYEEFEADFRAVEPSLVWIDTNEFQTLKDSVPTGTYVKAAIGQSPISVSTSSSTATISLNSGTALNGYLLVADGAGGTIWNPASTSGLTSVVGVSPISSTISGGTVSVSLTANYQTAGTYVNAVIGTSPASVVTASGTSTVSIDQAAITGATAATNAQTVRTYVKNTTGSTIALGKAVYVSGATGDNALISLSTASTEVGSSKTLGITAESIANDAFGYVVESGYLTGIDTTGISAGTSIWLGTTPGSLAFGAPPAEPNHSVYLGVVIREQQNNGSILVKVQNGYELDELHDVSAGSPTDLDILQYKNSSGLWTKASIASAGIASSVHTHNYQPSGNYQTAGTYVNAVVGTSPASVSTTSGTSTVSIIAGSINSTHIADNAIVAAKIAAASVGTAAISSGSATSGQLLQANGTGGAIFATIPSGATVSISEFTATGTWTKPAGAKAVYVWLLGAGAGGGGGNRAISTNSAASANGGGGGGGNYRIFDASILPSTVTVTIGAGGTGGIGLSATTTTGTGSDGAAGGDSYFGAVGNDYLRSGGGAFHTSNTGGAPAWTPLTLNASTRNIGSTPAFEIHSNNSNVPIDQRGFAAGGALSPSVTSTTSVANLAGANGARGYNIFSGISAAVGGSTAGVAGGSATTGFGTSGASGGSNNTASGLNSGNGGNGGNGYRGGGGGGGGSVWAASGTARNTGNGGNGGDGYALVISW